MKIKLGITGLYLFVLAAVLFLAKTIDLPYGYIPQWAGYIGLGLMFLGIVFMAIDSGPWNRIKKSGDHDAPFRIRKPKKEE